MTKAINTNTEEQPAEEEKTEETDEREPFKIAFIGGSLTEGNTTWPKAVMEFYQEKMPDKKLKKLMQVSAELVQTTVQCVFRITF